MRQRRGDEIEPGAVAADDDEIGHAHMRREQRDLGLRIGRHLIGERIDLQKAVGLGKGRDGARPLAGRVGNQAVGALDQRHHDEFGAAEFGGDPHRHARGNFCIVARRQARHSAQDRHDHVVEGEHRRGRKSRQDHHRLAVADGETQRLARLQRDAVRNDAGLAEPRDDAMGDVARALRRAAGEHQHVALDKRVAHRGFKRGFIVGDRTEETRLAAIFRDRGGDDRTVGVVDRSRPQRHAGLHQFVAGREESQRAGGARPTAPRCRRPPACRSRANRSWCRRAAAPRRARCRSRHKRRIARARPCGGFRSRGFPPAGCARPSRWRPRRAAPARRLRSASPCPTARAGPAPCRRRSPRH